jgi:hypothetical protein
MANSDRHVEGSANRTPGDQAHGLRLLLSYVWALLPVLTLGQLAPIPIIHAAIKLRTWTLWAASAVYSAAAIVYWSATTTVTVGDEPADAAAVPETPGWTFFLSLALMAVPTAHALAVRGRV